MKDEVTIASDADRMTKGERSKQAIKDAARLVFEEVGYVNARVQDIASRAGFSNGAFYRYFNDKHDLMMSLLRGLLEEAYLLVPSPWIASEPSASVYVSTFRYLTFYRDNSDLFRVLVEVSQIDEQVAAMWTEVRDAMIARISRMLERARDEGLLRENIDISVAAGLLTAMTDHYAYLLFVAKRVPERDVADISEQISALWAGGVMASPGAASAPSTVSAVGPESAG